MLQKRKCNTLGQQILCHLPMCGFVYHKVWNPHRGCYELKKKLTENVCSSATDHVGKGFRGLPFLQLGSMPPYGR